MRKEPTDSARQNGSVPFTPQNLRAQTPQVTPFTPQNFDMRFSDGSTPVTPMQTETDEEFFTQPAQRDTRPSAARSRAAARRALRRGMDGAPRRKAKKQAETPPAEGEAPAAKRRKKRSLPARLVMLCCALLACLAAWVCIDTALALRHDDLWLELEALPYRDATVLYTQNAQTGEWEEYTRLYATQQKLWVDMEEIPPDLQHAFVAVEDKNFYKHHGVAWMRTAYAVLNEGKHAVTGSYFGGADGAKQGASTITQQLVKNLTLDDSADGTAGYLRKVREITRALILDKKYSKDEILEAYLNVVGLTGNTAGVQAESYKLFNKPVSQLTLPQCASLAAITKNPSRYNPVTHPEANLQRRNYILQLMCEQGYISEAQRDEAMAAPLGLQEGIAPMRQNGVTSYFTDEVLREVTDDLTQEYGITRQQAAWLLYNGGLRIYTTVDAPLQSAMESAVQNGGAFRQSGLGVPSTAAVYNADGTVQTDENGQPVREPVTEYPQAAMVSVDYSGALKACVGGIGPKTVSRGFNRATQAQRQVGSTMKPIGAYVLALENNRIHWSSMFLDAPTRMVKDEKTGQETEWPANFSKTYSNQNMTVEYAFAHSINTVAVRVGQRAGVGRIYRFVRNTLGITGFTAQDKDEGPMILGSSTYGVTPYELAGAYMMFGSGGTVSTLHSYTQVQNGCGTALLQKQVQTKQAVSPGAAYVTNRLLQTVVQYGTAAGYSVNDGMESVGKTGTSSDNRDFWFVGLTPYYCTAVWYGYDSGFALNNAGGTSAAAAAWQRVMRASQGGLPHKEFAAEPTVVQVQYCTQTGQTAGAGCPQTRTGYYLSDNIPPACTAHEG